MATPGRGAGSDIELAMARRAATESADPEGGDGMLARDPWLSRLPRGAAPARGLAVRPGEATLLLGTGKAKRALPPEPEQRADNAPAIAKPPFGDEGDCITTPLAGENSSLVSAVCGRQGDPKGDTARPYSGEKSG